MAESECQSDLFNESYVRRRHLSCRRQQQHQPQQQTCKLSCTNSKQNVNNSLRKYATSIALSILILATTLVNGVQTSSSSTLSTAGTELTPTAISTRFNSTNELPTKLMINGKVNLQVSSTTPFSTTASSTTTAATTTSKAMTSTTNSQSMNGNRDRRINPVSSRNTNDDNNGQTTVASDLVASPSSISSTTVRLSAPTATYSTTEFPSSTQAVSTARNSDFSSTFSNRRLLASSRASDASDWSTPASSSSLLSGQSNSASGNTGSNNNYGSDQQHTQKRRQNTASEQVESQSTSQQSRFAEPTASTAPSQFRQNTRPDKQQSQQQPAQQHRPQKSASSGSNKWTHFGARLKPLAGAAKSSTGSQQVAQNGAIGSNENHIGAASSSNPSAIPTNFAQVRGAHSSSNQMVAPNGQRYLVAANGASSMAPVIGNSVATAAATNDNTNGDDNDDEDDLDSEALLYKMMQQQTFLMNPNMADQPTMNVANGNKNSGYNRQGSQASHAASLSNGDADGSSTSAISSDSPANSKKVIKLLKSYSHIHQVDDSDDQIRGTYTRLSARRPQQSSTSTSMANYRPQQQQRRQSISSGATGSTRPHHNGQHIHVSLKPVAQASFNQRANRQPVAINQQFSSTASTLSSSDANNDVSDDGNSLEGNQLSASADNSNDGSGLTAAAAAQNSPMEEEEFECPNNGIFADVASGCQAYHVCQSGAQVQQRFQCPLGTLFNDIILTCDFAHNVQCNNQAKPMVQAWPDQGGEEAPQSQTRAPAPVQLPPQARPQASAPVQARRPQQVYPSSQAMNVQRPSSSNSNGGWSPSQSRPQAAQTGGPRQLVIGSQYNRHNGVYPPQHPSSSSTTTTTEAASPASNIADNSDDDNDDNEPIEALIPATLPPSPRTQMVQLAPSLPFQAPPQASSRQLSSNQYRQPQVIYGVNSGSAMAYGDGTSATTPARAAEHSTSGQTSPASSKHNKDDAQAFNLVINHVSPTHKQNQQQVQSSQQSPLRPIQANPTPQLQQQQPRSYNSASLRQSSPVAHVALPKAAQNSAVYVSKQALANPFLPQTGSQKLQQQPQRSAQAASNSRQQQATASKQPRRASQQPQPQPQHYEATQSAVRPTLVDLSNAKQAQSVSSEALNDGLLLIVRHSSGANPLQLASSSSASLAKPAQTSSNSYEQKSSTGRRSTKADYSNDAQAYVVDPKAVNPSSQLDAQLFPNVQRFVADKQMQQASNGQRSQVNNRPSALASHLPPLEPPQAPANEDKGLDEPLQAAYATSRTAVSDSRTSGGAESNHPKEVSQAQARAQQQTITRTKRLKAAPAPPTKSQTSHKIGEEKATQMNANKAHLGASTEQNKPATIRPATNQSQQQQNRRQQK